MPTATATPQPIVVDAQLSGTDGIITWNFTADRQTLWFHVFRSETPNLSDAKQITNFFFPAPFAGEKIYQYEDTSLPANGQYYYWIQQLYGNGDIEMHGPDDLVVTGLPEGTPSSTPVSTPNATPLSNATPTITPSPTSTPQVTGPQLGLNLNATLMETEGLVTWEFTADRQTLWFRVHRSKTQDFDDAEELTVSFIPANAIGTQSFKFEDPTLTTNGTYYYWVEQISGGSTTELHGPAPLSITRFASAVELYLPLINN